MSTKLTEADIKRVALILAHPDVFPMPADTHVQLAETVMTGEISPAFGWQMSMYVLHTGNLSDILFAANFIRLLSQENQPTFRSYIAHPDRLEFDRIAREHGLIP